MKNSRLLIHVSLLAFILFLGCNKTDSPSNSKPYTPEYVTATLSGRVTDNSKEPVSGAIVKAGTATATTDINGSFTLSNVQVDKNAAFVKVEKEGFFLGTKTIVASTGNNNAVVIQLIPKTVAGTITATSGGTVTVPEKGGSIAFEANSIINPNGNAAYSGAVEVSAFFINPEATDFNEIMPGTLRGITTNNEETGLQSFGMMAVELTGSAGEKLQLAPGKKATLHFPIPAGLQGEAPASIPLWSLDETTGLWKEEGEATKQGTEYIGTVGHFSFWNCDAPFPIIDFTATIKDANGNGLNAVEVVIEVPAGSGTAGSTSASSYTNAEGLIFGKIPANKTLQLKIYNKCRTLLHSQNIGPFSRNTELGAIAVNYNSSQVTISGAVVNCKQESVANGFVSIKLEDIFYNVPVTNGKFSTTITRCNSTETTAAITAFDLEKQVSGTASNLTISGSTADAGQLYACGVAAEMFIRYTVEGVDYSFAPPKDTFMVYEGNSTNNFVAITAKPEGRAIEQFIIIFKRGAELGPTKLYVIDLYNDDNSIHYTKSQNDTEVNITEFDDASGFIAGNFSAILRDSAGTQTYPITGNFRVKR
ncbi:MAG: carboxypeptidase-like regulatory domain-containing protein [Candidatus Pseudobacter hemicellulosilyticus]|uniref:Carboxypeptidase-like regulatory domain-containing protein n=1 Tax=Candidatus Pseudobacter hemicellulosilyticus TaxID=3121375 RepID=A0AAJ6BEW7_9BACT|nr:MAG: carboxypeptidase-like regulatory domain-containing protein [Pseudobacter sp.]